MSLRVAVQMDPIKGVNPLTDTTVFLMREAQARGHSLFVYQPNALAMEDGAVRARGQAVTLTAETGDFFTAAAPTVEPLAGFDVILMRQDPPFNLAYITAAHFLEKVHPKTLVVNNPAEVRNAPEKLFVTDFPGLQPPTLITADAEALREFHAREGDIVLKPLHGGAGSGVVKLKAGDPNLDALLELHAEIGPEPVIAQKFVPAIVRGDKRIILVDGEPVGAINRVPGEGQVRSNLARGGRAEAVELTPRDLEICATIGPSLRERGLLFVGIDVIGDYLTEINVTSPTGAQQMKRFGGPDAAVALWDRAEAIRRGG